MRMQHRIGAGCKGTIATALLALAWLAQTAWAEDGGNSSAQANNPLANMTAFNMQNYYIGGLTESDDDANQFWFRYAGPFSVGESNWLLRASLPINTFGPRRMATRTRGSAISTCLPPICSIPATPR
jgi:hypothetical protein